MARQGRQVAIVIAAATVLWLGANALGAAYGWQERYAFLFDLAALAAYFWALVVTYGIWRRRQAGGREG